MERNKKRVREIAFDVDFTDQLARQAPDVTLYAQGILDGLVKELHYQQTPDSIMYAVLEDGTVKCASYNRAQQLNGWARFDTDGTVYSMCVVPANDYDQVWIAVFRNGSTQLEYFDETGGFYDKVQFDSTVIYSGAATATLTGYGHLEGKTVGVLGDGANLGTFVVSGGQVALDVEVSRAEGGLPFVSSVELLRPGRLDAVTLGHAAQTVRVTVGLLDTIGGAINGEAFPDRTIDDMMDGPPAPFSGYAALDGNFGDVDHNAITITQPDPFPMTVTMVARIVDVSEL